MTFSRFLLAAALALPAAALHAVPMGRCAFDAGSGLQRSAGGYLFPQAPQAEVRIRDGRLFVGDAEASLSGADRAQLRAFQAELDAVVAEARALGMEVASLALDALSEVALAFFGDDPETLQRFEQRLAKLESEIRASLPQGDGPVFDEDAFRRAMEAAMRDIAPMLAGQVAGRAVLAALRGDHASSRDLEARAARLEREIEARVQVRARQIEARAEALCPRIQALAARLQALEYRHPDGSRLNLLRPRG